MLTLHGNAIKLDDCGILITGQSGAGKSDLTLRLLNKGATLIADDGVLIEKQGDTPTLSPVKSIAGLMEIRGLGLVRRSYVEKVPLSLWVELITQNAIVRLPKTPFCTIFGKRIYTLLLDGLTASAPHKIQAAVHLIKHQKEGL